MNPQDLRNHIAKSCGFTPNKANHVIVDGLESEPTTRRSVQQVCSAGEWPEDFGGNFDPTRREANFAFSEWLDQQGDSLPLPSSFSEWCEQNNDSTIE